MRISDWSSDVCSSDLFLGMVREAPALIAEEIAAVRARTDRPFGVNLIPAATDAALLDAELAVCFEQRVHSLCFFWDVDAAAVARAKEARSEEHTSELQSLMRISYAVFCLKTKTTNIQHTPSSQTASSTVTRT